MAEQHSQLFSFGDATDSVIWKPFWSGVIGALVGLEFTTVKYSVIGDAFPLELHASSSPTKPYKFEGLVNTE